MLLVMDVGNTTTVVGVFDREQLVAHWRLSSILHTSDEWGVYILTLLGTKDIASTRIDGAVFCSVVPTLDTPLAEAMHNFFRVEPLRVDASTDTGMEVRYDAPREVGADRIVNAVGGRSKYGAPLIVADYGTAITFDVIAPDGAYLGGAIGVQPERTVIFALWDGEEKGLLGSAYFTQTFADLGKVKGYLNFDMIGRNTNESIQSGILFGNAGLTDRIVGMIRAEMGTEVKVAATGGHAEVMAKLSQTIEYVDP